jgi:hypothetical protein
VIRFFLVCSRLNGRRFRRRSFEKVTGEMKALQIHTVYLRFGVRITSPFLTHGRNHLRSLPIMGNEKAQLVRLCRDSLICSISTSDAFLSREVMGISLINVSLNASFFQQSHLNLVLNCPLSQNVCSGTVHHFRQFTFLPLSKSLANGGDVRHQPSLSCFADPRPIPIRAEAMRQISIELSRN